MPDLLGFGRSPKPDGSYTIGDHLAALRRTMIHLWVGDQPFVIVGHSLGSILAVEYASRYPAEIAGLVLLSLPCYQSKEEAQAYIIEHGQWMARVTVLNGGIAHLVHLVVATLRPLLRFVVRHSPSGLPPEVAEDALSHTWPSYSGTLEHCILSHDLTPALRQLPDIPILAIHGRDDPSAPVGPVQLLATTRSAMHLVLLPDGHHVFLTEDEACLAAMERFIFDLPSHQPRA
jgi:pimeloyl-ACP methyl ester carboxylesterase